MKTLKIEIFLFLLIIYSIDICYGLNSGMIKKEFKIEVNAGSEECFYQTLKEGYNLYASFQTIKGDDINFIMKNPNGGEIYRLTTQNKGTHHVLKNTIEGDYSVCLDNTYSLINSKYVFIYMLTYNTDEVRKDFEEKARLNFTQSILSNSTLNILTNLVNISIQQLSTKSLHARDDYIAQSNNQMIVYWSIIQNIIIFISSAFQIFFIKRLFSPSTRKSLT